MARLLRSRQFTFERVVEVFGINRVVVDVARHVEVGVEVLDFHEEVVLEQGLQVGLVLEFDVIRVEELDFLGLKLFDQNQLELVDRGMLGQNHFRVEHSHVCRLAGLGRLRSESPLESERPMTDRMFEKRFE